MVKHNANNERIKRQYFVFLKEAKRHSEATVDAVAKALARFEVTHQVSRFQSVPQRAGRRLQEAPGGAKQQETGRETEQGDLARHAGEPETVLSMAGGQPGYKSRLKYSDAEYFNLSEKDTRIATARREKKFPTLEQVKHVIGAMPSNSEIEQRDRAVVAFTLLTGARDSAIASMKLKHVDLAANCVYQDAREVNTKASKTFTTFFFPVGDEIRQIVEDWVKLLRETKLWGNDDPLFPATKVAVTRNTDSR